MYIIGDKINENIPEPSISPERLQQIRQELIELLGEHEFNKLFSIDLASKEDNNGF